MTLQDIVRDKSRDALASLQAADMAIEGAERDYAAAHSQLAQIRREIAELRESLRTKQEFANTQRGRVQALEEEIRRLTAEADRERQEQLKLESQVDEIDHAIAERRKTERKEEERAQLSAAQKDKLIGARQEHHKRLREAKKQALEVYAAYVWRRLFAFSGKQDERRKAVESHNALRKARSADPEVMRLLEALEYYERTYESSAPELVRDEAKKWIQEIRGKIEAQFPGALDVERLGRSQSEVEELFCAEDANGGTILYLPVPSTIWTAVERGDEDSATALGVCLAWATCKCLGTVLEFECGEGMVRARTSSTSEDLCSTAQLRVELAGNLVVDFIISTLPRDVAEALS